MFRRRFEQGGRAATRRGRRNELTRAAWVVVATVLGLGTGCAEAEQGPHCRAYIDCVRQADAERDTETNVDRFLADGACWDGVKGAAVCESSCRRGIPVLQKQEPSITCEAAP